MCGIAGIVSKDSRLYQKVLQLMVESIGHRGPDGKGTHFFDNCAFGHTRLSIVDLVSGDQPMISGKTALVFNGEIYGYQNIKKKLTGYHFTTTSDTEVVLALYHKHGEDFVKYLPGMFAFALWDNAKHELICARDRFGEKPFYYAFGPSNELIFASEIKGVLASGLIRPVLNMMVVRSYLKHLYVPPNETIYQNVYCLPPAHVLMYKNGKVKIIKYWSPILPIQKIGFGDAVEKFQQLFSRAIANQLIADVPVGVFLSGGMDSSSVVAIASRYKSKIKTFSFGFDGGRNELPYAREVARRYKTDHHEFLEKDVQVDQLITTMSKVYDEPFADSSNIPTYLISKLARKYVKVALTGDGGDELLGGYSNWYKPLFFMNEKKSFFWPKLILLQALSWGYFLGGFRFPQGSRFQLEGLKYRLQYSNVGQAHNRQLSYFSDHELDGLGLPRETGREDKINSLNRLLQEDVQNYLAGDILVKTDRASMAWGLELRAPFLDVDLASFCLSLPFTFKIDDKSDKILLREVSKQKLPETILGRKKQGFGAPIEFWLKKRPMVALINRYLKDPEQKIFTILPYNNVQSLVWKNDYHTWALLNLSLWMSVHDYDIKS